MILRSARPISVLDRARWRAETEQALEEIEAFPVRRLPDSRVVAAEDGPGLVWDPRHRRYFRKGEER
jgi:hypothetical protein